MSKLEILHRDDLTEGGFAGLREHRLVMDSRLWGHHADPSSWPGIGNFVYLADARFNPHGETRMHPHHEIDVISVMVEGRIAHEGSLGHGSDLNTFDVQIQRAGGEGFSHNEINPDDVKNRMLQLWVAPEEPGEPAGYKIITAREGEVTRVYGGTDADTPSFAAETLLDIARLKPGQETEVTGPFLVYVATGEAEFNGEQVRDGHLVRGTDGRLTAKSDALIIIASVAGDA